MPRQTRIDGSSLTLPIMVRGLVCSAVRCASSMVPEDQRERLGKRADGGVGGDRTDAGVDVVATGHDQRCRRHDHDYLGLSWGREAEVRVTGGSDTLGNDAEIPRTSSARLSRFRPNIDIIEDALDGCSDPLGTLAQDAKVEEAAQPIR